MKTKTAATYFLAAGLMASMLANAADVDADKGKPGVFIKDSAITTKVKTKLAAEHLKSIKNIKVETDADGIVWLSGTAGTQAEIDRAEALTRDTAGVKSVKNNISVKAGS